MILLFIWTVPEGNSAILLTIINTYIYTCWSICTICVFVCGCKVQDLHFYLPAKRLVMVNIFWQVYKAFLKDHI